MTTDSGAASYADLSLEQADPVLAALIKKELARQQRNIELIASENFTPLPVLQAVGTVLTNKYAEGYPGGRYYGGCEVVDEIESLAIERACALYGAEHANVQPHSGSTANQAVYWAMLEAGDTVLAMSLAHGGHLTHGTPSTSPAGVTRSSTTVSSGRPVSSTWTRSALRRASTGLASSSPARAPIRASSTSPPSGP